MAIDFLRASKLLKNYVETIQSQRTFSIHDLSHPLLNRETFGSNLLLNVILEKPSQGIKINELVKQILYYFYRNTKEWLIFFPAWILSLIYQKKLPWDKWSEVIVIDSYAVVQKILRDGKYNEIYFNNLPEMLNSRGLPFFYFPTFSFLEFNPLRTLRLFKILAKESDHFLIPFSLLTLKDVLKILSYTLVHPFSHLSLYQRKKSPLDQLFNEELIVKLGEASFWPYVRFLAGRQLAKRPLKKIKVISWWENQAISKNLFRGLREHPDCRIYGCQLYIFGNTFLNYFPTDSEYHQKLLPDHILCNGNSYIRRGQDLSPTLAPLFRIGPSLRYKRLFEINVDMSLKRPQKFFVCLSYFLNESLFLLELLRNSPLIHVPLKIREHPSNSQSMIKDMLMPQWQLVQGDLYAELIQSEILITTTSGTAAEALALGTSVLLAAAPETLNASYLDPMGKGVSWDMAHNLTSWSEKLEELLECRQTKSSEVESIQRYYRDQFFTYPSNELIQKAFDL